MIKQNNIINCKRAKYNFMQYDFFTLLNLYFIVSIYGKYILKWNDYWVINELGKCHANINKKIECIEIQIYKWNYIRKIEKLCSDKTEIIHA